MQVDVLIQNLWSRCGAAFFQLTGIRRIGRSNARRHQEVGNLSDIVFLFQERWTHLKRHTLSSAIHTQDFRSKRHHLIINDTELWIFRVFICYAAFVLSSETTAPWITTEAPGKQVIGRKWPITRHNFFMRRFLWINCNKTTKDWGNTRNCRSTACLLTE